MKMVGLLTSAILNLLVLNVNICPVFAEAPTVSKILFTSARDGNYEVYIMNPDGTEQTNLTRHRAQDLEAIWSPTGEQILFISDRGRVRDLYLMDADGSNVRRFFKSKTEDPIGYPTWAPNGQQIAYTRLRWNNRKFPIYIATLEEQEEEELGVDGLFLAWSPDGTEIASTVQTRLTLINVHTRKGKQLLPKKAIPGQLEPSWSAAGDKLAFSWNNKPVPPDHMPGDKIPDEWFDTQTIYIVNRDGTGLQQLIDEAGPKAQYPELSPNGEEVLYTQEINGQFQIFKIDVNSKIQTQLTHIEWNFGGDWFDPTYALPVPPQPNFLTTIWGQLKTE